MKTSNAKSWLGWMILTSLLLSWPSASVRAAGAICDPGKGLYNITSLSTSYDPFSGDSFFTYKISAVAGAKDISNYVISTPACKDIKSFTSSGSVTASCVKNEKFSGLTGFKIDTPVKAPGSTTLTIEMNGSFTAGGGNWAVKAGTCPDSGGALTSVPIAKTATGTLKFKETNPTVSETAGKVLVTVSRVGGSVGTLTVNYKTTDVTAVAGTNYTAVSGTLTWAAGDSADKAIEIPIANTKTFYEAAKTFTVTLSTPDNKYTAVNTVSILSNPKITVANVNYVISSFAKVAVVTLVRTAGVDPAETVTAVVNTKDITALAGTDYVAVTDLVVTLNPGETVTAVPVTMTVAQLPPPGNRLFAVAVKETAAPFREAATTVTIRGTAASANVSVAKPQDGETLTAVTTVSLAASANVTPKLYAVTVASQVVATLKSSSSTADLDWDTTTVADGDYTLAGQVTYDDADGNQTLEESDPITVTVANNASKSADVNVTVVPTTASAFVDDQVLYDVHVINAGPDDTMVTATIAVLPNSTVVLAKPTDPNDSCKVGLTEITCILSLKAVTGTDITVIKTYQVGGIDYVEDVQVAGDVPDPNLADNKATFTATISDPYADLNVTVVPTSATAAVNDQVGYDVHVINAGPRDAIASVTIPILANSSVFLAKPVDPNDSCKIGLTEITCTLSTKAVAGSDITVIKTYQVGGVRYVEDIQVGGNISDPNPADNKATFTADIQ